MRGTIVLSYRTDNTSIDEERSSNEAMLPDTPPSHEQTEDPFKLDAPKPPGQNVLSQRANPVACSIAQ
jgi:hypothetical protein